MNSIKFQNTFDAVTDDKVVATELQFKADLMIALRDIVEEKGWEKVDAAKELKLSRAQVSDFFKGRIDKFSIDLLMTYLLRVGFRFKPQYESGILRIEVQNQTL